jgi:hypothetical protein
VESLRARNRIVVFRLSQEEYTRLRSACAAAGGRNLSDFTRTELLAAVQTDGRGAAIERRFLEMERKLDDLHTLIQRLSERVASPEPVFAGVQNGSGGE